MSRFPETTSRGADPPVVRQMTRFGRGNLPATAGNSAPPASVREREEIVMPSLVSSEIRHDSLLTRRRRHAIPAGERGKTGSTLASSAAIRARSSTTSTIIGISVKLISVLLEDRLARPKTVEALQHGRTLQAFSVGGLDDPFVQRRAGMAQGRGYAGRRGGEPSRLRIRSRVQSSIQAGGGHLTWCGSSARAVRPQGVDG